MAGRKKAEIDTAEPVEAAAAELQAEAPEKTEVAMTAVETGDGIETGIRAYLNYLADPAVAVDMDKVAQLEVAAENAADLIEKLRLLGELERTRTPDPTYLEDEFVRNVKEWADAEGIGASVFISMGVPEDVLRRARMIKGRGGSGRRQRSNPRGGRVTVEIMQAWALSQEGMFTIKDVTQALGGSLVTANKALQLLVDAGSLTSVGPDPEHRGPGRAPNRFAVKRGRSRAKAKA